MNQGCFAAIFTRSKPEQIPRLILALAVGRVIKVKIHHGKLFFVVILFSVCAFVQVQSRGRCSGG